MSSPETSSPEQWAFDLADHEHAPSSGSRVLRLAVAEHLSREHGAVIPAERVLITAGATHAIGIIVRAITDPGDEVIVLSPQWLFAAGLVRAARATCIEVPVFVELSEDPTRDLAEMVVPHVTEATRAIYFNSPNNPTGYSLTSSQLGQLVDLAEELGLWLIADNAYENFDYTPAGFRDALTFDRGDRTFAVYTFSKTYAMPGFRVGCVVMPDRARRVLEAMALYSVYSVSSPSQRAAVCALSTSPSELAARRRRAQMARDILHANLEVPHTHVDGGLYTFLDLRGLASSPGTFLDGCLASGVALAPGDAFGERFGSWARLCFTAVDESQLPGAIDRINRVYGSLT
jgi:aspartate aminotransferase/N-succinyldiaminopimelate aminotransferase